MRLSPICGASLLIAAAFTIRTLMDPLLGDRSPFLFFTVAVLFAGARYGVKVGLLVTVLSTVVGRWAFLAPRHSFGQMTSDEWTNVAAFIVTSLAMLIFTNQLVRSREAERATTTENRETAERLAESQQRLAGIVDSAMDAIITVNKKQEIILFNPAAEAMFGYSASEAMGKAITILIPERFRSDHERHVDRFRLEGVTSRRMRSLGTLSGVRSSGDEFPVEASISHVVVGEEELATVILRDITDRKLNEEAQILLAREVDHRAKNALAVAQALVSLTRADTVPEYSKVISGRIASLARAHSLLSKSRWTGASLRQVVCDEVTTYARHNQIGVGGPDATLSAEAVQPLSLVVHELATNALKHGALSAAAGHVSVTWEIVGGLLVLRWVERGGPVVSRPEKSGFGSKLLDKTVTRQLEAGLDLDWSPEGLGATLSIPAHLFSASGTSGAVVSRDSPSSLQSDGRGRTVLIVEDEELVALELAAEMESDGWKVLGPAASVAEAEGILREVKSFDAAVLDVNLRGRPVYPFAEALVDKRIPFLFSTGYEIVDPSGRFPTVPVVRKPTHKGAVAAALDRMLLSSEDRG